MENYILCCPPEQRKHFAKLRISAHRLAIETGRYTRPKTPLDERICTLCSLNKIENEFHMIMECPFYKCERDKFIIELEKIINVTFTPDNDMFYDIMNAYDGDPEICKLVCAYVDACFQLRPLKT